jgi:excisionase family DNA binding protein
MSDPLKDWMKTGEAATYLDIQRITLYRWCKARKVPCRKVGGQWWFRRDELEIWRDKQPGVRLDEALGESVGCFEEGA